MLQIICDVRWSVSQLHGMKCRICLNWHWATTSNPELLRDEDSQTFKRHCMLGGWHHGTHLLVHMFSSLMMNLLYKTGAHRLLSIKIPVDIRRFPPSAWCLTQPICWLNQSLYFTSDPQTELLCWGRSPLKASVWVRAGGIKICLKRHTSVCY